VPDKAATKWQRRNTQGRPQGHLGGKTGNSLYTKQDGQQTPTRASKPETQRGRRAPEHKFGASLSAHRPQTSKHCIRGTDSRNQRQGTQSTLKLPASQARKELRAPAKQKCAQGLHTEASKGKTASKQSQASKQKTQPSRRALEHKFGASLSAHRP
jgi:hypothetical protein